MFIEHLFLPINGKAIEINTSYQEQSKHIIKFVLLFVSFEF
jgi:hypothetical protein